jgi:asparagine synthase (glutamine-hydrolysing)
MCGIAGIVSFNNSVNIPAAIKSIADVIKHRGPDDEGYLLANKAQSLCLGGPSTPIEVWQTSSLYQPAKPIEDEPGEWNVALAHRRLSILDLSPAGHQPLTYPNTSLWITFNGEIYNYKELREELKKLGHQFYTESDTEVLLVSYIQWGADCVERLNGMWSFVIYDAAKNILFGSRDRVGVKPFYYYKDSSLFAFASEQKALVRQKFIKTGINEKAVFDFFIKDEIEYEKEGMFKNIFELFPGHSFSLDIGNGDLKFWRYFHLRVNPHLGRFDDLRYNELIDKTEELLVNSIRTHLRSDVTVGACLSGGIDSSAIVGIMSTLNKHKPQIPVFTATFPGSSIDESKWAKKVVNHTNVSWHTVTPTSSDLRNDLRDLIYCQDVPIWSTSTYAQYRVMKLVKEAGIKVILDGQGGDEMFAGYDPYHYTFWKQLLNRGQLTRLAGEVNGFGINKALRLALYMNKKVLSQKLSLDTSILLPKEYKFLNQDFVRNYKHATKDKIHSHANLNEELAAEFYNSRLKGYLKCEDRCSMNFSVESRVPFADDAPLMHYVFNLPSTYKLHKGVSKSLLREAAKPYLPAEIYNRTDKMGYATPNNKWISEIEGSMVDLFTDDLKPYLDVESIRKNHSLLFNSTSKSDNGRMFKFISFAMWKNIFY